MHIRSIVARIATALSVLLVGTSAHAHDVTAPKPGPALWQVSDDDTTIYLFGTVHVLPRDIDWYDARIASAFEASDTLVTEIDMQDPMAVSTQVTSMAALKGESSLRDLMPPEDRAQYEAALSSLQLPVPTFDKFEPWFVSASMGLLPLLKAGYDPESGVEIALGKRAEGKTRGSLETVAEQTSYFDTLPMDAQLGMLDQVVEGIDTIPAQIDTMVEHWISGDPDGLATVMNSDIDDPRVYQRLLLDRNANWVEWIAKRMEQPGTVFVAVGAGHLAGKGSVQELLAEKGLTAERVWE